MPFRGEPRMEAIRVERLDHLGLIASVINDIGLVSLVDARLKPDDQEAITPGEAVKGMILNGLGFANRPLSLTPQFFANKPLDLLFRPGVRAEMFNRFNPTATLLEHTSLCQGFMGTSKVVSLVAGDRKIVILRGQFWVMPSSVAVGLMGDFSVS